MTLVQRWCNVVHMMPKVSQLFDHISTIFQCWANVVMLSGKKKKIMASSSYLELYMLIIYKVDSNRHLEWLKSIQKAHGSVEVSSLAQAEAINSNGVFSCGFLNRKIQDDTVLVRRV